MSVRNGLLALLATGNHHGYELRKELEERTGSLWDLNVGQVYTTLGRLERDGFVVEVGHEPATGGGPDQRQWALTEAGRNELRDWFTTARERSAPDRDELVIKLTLAASVDGVDLDEVIDLQRATTTADLQRYTRLKAATEPEDTARLFALDAVISQINAELQWLEQCQQRHAATRGTGTWEGRR
jgi:DNA-binding PadR family transcriptional regulator